MSHDEIRDALSKEETGSYTITQESFSEKLIKSDDDDDDEYDDDEYVEEDSNYVLFFKKDNDEVANIPIHNINGSFILSGENRQFRNLFKLVEVDNRIYNKNT